MKKLLLSTLLILFVSGCSVFQSGDNFDIPFPDKFKYRQSYKLGDFHLNDDYTYWEVCQNGPRDTSRKRTKFSFNKRIYQQLSDKQRKKIDDTILKRSGFLCLPGNRCDYGIGLKNENVTIIDSDKSLLKFFGQIDTEAELSLWLWAKSYSSLGSYKKTKEGYLAVAKIGDACIGTRKKEVISVKMDGSISSLHTISTKHIPGCIH